MADGAHTHRAEAGQPLHQVNLSGGIMRLYGGGGGGVWLDSRMIILRSFTCASGLAIVLHRNYGSLSSSTSMCFYCTVRQ